jgi:predicted amidohydrolase
MSELGAGEVRVAVVQRPPLLLDRAGTLRAAVSHLHEAADAGARVIVFPETYIPGYPVWIWRLRPEEDSSLTGQIHPDRGRSDRFAHLLGELHAAGPLCALRRRGGDLRRGHLGRGETWIATMRHIAAEGRCWVIGAGCSLRAGDIPPAFPGRERLFPDPDEWLNPGDSVIVAPGGDIVAGPLHEEHGLLFAQVDPGRVAGAHRTLDVAGHYSRNDIFRLTIDRSALAPVVYEQT